MIEAAINKILGLAEPKALIFDGLKYTNQQLRPVLDPIPVSLKVETLTGMMDYIKANRDGINLSKCVLIIDDYKVVRLIGAVEGAFKQRSVFIGAHCDRDFQHFGSYLDIEAFIIWLQANFLDAGDRSKVLALVGNIQDGQVSTFADDGVTQGVTVKAGITKVENVSVPNPVSLTPYRTFIDAVQPPSDFVFRLKSGAGSEQPKAALFEADGGKWKSDAVQNIKKYLVDELARIQADIPVIA